MPDGDGLAPIDIGGVMWLPSTDPEVRAHAGETVYPKGQTDD